MLKAAVLSALFSQCAPDVSPITLHALVGVESSGKPYVVANVSDGTSHSFDKKDEAIVFVNDLASKNKTYSAGLMQIYSKNFTDYQLTNETVFDHCTNIKVGADILNKCFVKSLKENPSDKQGALRKAFSCYYSGNMTRGFKKEGWDGKSYVQRIELKAEKNYSVPEIQVNSNSSPTVKEQEKPVLQEAVLTQQKINKHQWDVFGDY
ncbi:lytic transglycosylase domain-containing protein [Xenorhabdus bovienii]|uniref:lytic transglycosylase domain-containing protein n=1 Tax=Xenorhabdus bovienii TaxID=40576 RepID=UPI0023B2DD53|nr:lytic transglycosylase domain-containing protein [Xenorhabdus bovienii]MDE9544130.1 lytic transglycosylase domain-containing protein [Xenorhabdus bovienii]